MKKRQQNIPRTWEMVRLGDFVENEKGKKPTNQQLLKDEIFRYPYIDIEAFEQHRINSYTDGENCRFCKEDDFLMVWDGSRSGLVGKGVAGALGSTLVRINFPMISNDYAYYFLQSKYQQINSRSKGTGTPHVDPGLLWDYDFPIPPMNEQLRIVDKIEELFTEIDKGVESLKTAREQLKVYRQALLKHAFEGNLTKQWRKGNSDILETSEDLLEGIKNEREVFSRRQLDKWMETVKCWEENGSHGKKPQKPKTLSQFRTINPKDIVELSDLPSGWEWTYFENMLEYVTSGSRGWAKYYSETGAIFIRAQNIKYDYLDLSEIAYVDLPNKAEGTRTLTNQFDILITITGANVTKSAYLKHDIGESYVSQHVALSRLINPGYARYLHLFLIAALGGRRQLEKAAYGAGKPGLNLDNIKDIVIPISTSSECKLIVEFVEEKLSVIESIESEISEQLNKIKALRQSVLQKAFSGELIPQNINDEPAKNLLEKIKAQRDKVNSNNQGKRKSDQ